jgi:methyl-accepting chemotaxis protein
MAAATSGLAEGLKQLAGGNLTYELDAPFASEFEGLRADFNGAVSRLRDTLSQVAASTSTIDAGSREVKAGQLHEADPPNAARRALAARVAPPCQGGSRASYKPLV